MQNISRHISPVIINSNNENGTAEQTNPRVRTKYGYKLSEYVVAKAVLFRYRILKITSISVSEIIVIK